MISDLLTEQGLKGLSGKCKGLALDMIDDEHETMMRAALQFRQAANYLGRDMTREIFSWYKMTLSAACTDVRMARLSASFKAEKGDAHASERIKNYDAILRL